MIRAHMGSIVVMCSTPVHTQGLSKVWHQLLTVWPNVNMVHIVNIVNIVLVCSTALARIAAAALFCQISQGAHLRYSLLLRSPLASVLHIRIKKETEKQKSNREYGLTLVCFLSLTDFD